MRTKTLPFAAALLAIVFVATTVPAQTTDTNMAAKASSATPPAIWKFDEFAKQIKNPDRLVQLGRRFPGAQRVFQQCDEPDLGSEP